MDFSSLIRSDLSSFHSLFEVWASKIEADCLEAEQSELEYNQEAKEHINTLNNERLKLIELESLQQSESSEFQSKLAELTNKIDRLNKENLTLPVKLQQINLKQQQTQNQYELIKQTTNKTEIQQFQSLNSIQKTIKLFQTKLGIKFTVNEGKLKIIYTYINESMPEEEYFITIFIDENSFYQYEESSPMIEEEIIINLFKQLNEDNAFGVFVQKIRKVFVEMQKE